MLAGLCQVRGPHRFELTGVASHADHKGLVPRSHHQALAFLIAKIRGSFRSGVLKPTVLVAPVHAGGRCHEPVSLISRLFFNAYVAFKSWSGLCQSTATPG